MKMKGFNVSGGITTLLTSSRTQWALVTNFCSQATRKSYFLLEKAHAGHPGYFRFRALGSLQFFLEYSLGMETENAIVSLLLDRMPPHASEDEIHLYKFLGH